MEGVTFLDDEIQKEFGRFVEIRLHTDGGGRFAETSKINKDLLDKMFDTVSIPYYAVFQDPADQKPVWSQGGALSKSEVLAGLRNAQRVAQKPEKNKGTKKGK